MSESPTPVGLPARDSVRWDLLGDLAFEDTYALWEVVPRIERPTKDPVARERAEIAAQALLELLDSGLVFLYRLDGLAPNVASERQDLRLDRAEAAERVTRTLDDVGASGDIWIAATEEGVRLANDPPPAVKSMWGWETSIPARDT